MQNKYTLPHVLKILKTKGTKKNLVGMERFGMDTKKRIGVSMPDIRKIGKDIGKDHALADKLFNSGFAEGRILASIIDEPEKVTEKQMDNWVKKFTSWDDVDQVCMNLFDKTPLAWKKIREWSKRDEEFVKRTAFSLIACLAWHDKDAPDSKFIALLPIIKHEATDERNFVKKAVNWALRHIGKRNLRLNKVALKTAYEIQKMNDKTAKWIANDAIRELKSEAVKKRLIN